MFQQEIFVQRTYANIKNELIMNKDFKHKSVVLSLLSMKSNKVFEYINGSSEYGTKLELNSYIKEGLIIETDEKNTFCLTLKGIYYYEEYLNILNKDTLLHFLNNKIIGKYFTMDKSLSDSEKVIIFSLIAVRAFSIDSSVDLLKDDEINNKWEDIIRRSHNILCDLNIVNININDLLKQGKTETAISSLMRHTDKLPKKTRTLFKVKNPQKYYLNIDKDAENIQNNIEFLLKKIFIQYIDIIEINQVKRMMKEIAQNDSIFLFNMSKHKYLDYKYDIIMDDAIKNVL